MQEARNSLRGWQGTRVADTVGNGGGKEGGKERDRCAAKSDLDVHKITARTSVRIGCVQSEGEKTRPSGSGEE